MYFTIPDRTILGVDRFQVIGPESKGETVPVVLKDGSLKGFQYHGHLPLRQARWIPDTRKVKICVSGTCSTYQGHDFKPMDEGWYVGGLWMKTGVFIVTQEGEPITFFAPVAGC